MPDMTRNLIASAALLSLLGTAQASLVVSAPSLHAYSGYDGTPATITGTLTHGYTGTLTALSAGTISFTYLGKEAWNTTQFNFNGRSITDSTRLTDSARLGSTITGQISAGRVNFSFTDVTRGVTYQNGAIGAMMFTPGVRTSQYGAFDFVIGFNDKGVFLDPRDCDFDDFVVGVKFTPAIPEPSTYAMMGIGLVGLAWAARRRRATGR